MLPINIFPRTTQFTPHYIYNECLQDDCLTRTACKTVFKTYLNEGLFKTTSRKKCPLTQKLLCWSVY